jgi:hypothetical protein
MVRRAEKSEIWQEWERKLGERLEEEKGMKDSAELKYERNILC